MSTPVLAVKRCSKTYPNGHQAVRDVTFSIHPGQFTVLLGLNGAGKSSLISMITGLSHISGGSIAIDGIDLKQDPFRAKGQFGICPQEVNFNIFHTIEQELCIAAGLHGMSAKKAVSIFKPHLKRARLWEKRTQTIRSLSGGMKRVLMVIRALLHDPKLLILDEPTAGLDIEIRDLIWELLRDSHAKDTAVLLTTHNMAEAQALCQNILILHQGQLLRDQSIKEALLDLSVQMTHIELESPITPELCDILKDFKAQTVSEYTLLLETSTSHSLSQALSILLQQGAKPQRITPSRNQLEQLLQETAHDAR